MSVDSASGPGWCYLDRSGAEYGPFPDEKMRVWYASGLFMVGSALLVRLPTWAKHATVAELWPDSEPFAGPPRSSNDRPAPSSAAGAAGAIAPTSAPSAGPSSGGTPSPGGYPSGAPYGAVVPQRYPPPAGQPGPPMPYGAPPPGAYVASGYGPGYPPPPAWMVPMYPHHMLNAHQAPPHGAPPYGSRGSGRRSAASSRSASRSRSPRGRGARRRQQRSRGRESRKRPFEPHHSSVPKATDLEKRFANHAGAPTTAMLRNIPNRYMQESLMEEIDEEGFADSYDFFYLPIDVKNNANVGYAFINFLEAKDLDRFCEHFEGYAFKRPGSKKVASVSPAVVQGLKQNLENLVRKRVARGQHRPIVIHNGRRLDMDQAERELLSSRGSDKDS